MAKTLGIKTPERPFCPICYLILGKSLESSRLFSVSKAGLQSCMWLSSERMCDVPLELGKLRLLSPSPSISTAPLSSPPSRAKSFFQLLISDSKGGGGWWGVCILDPLSSPERLLGSLQGTPDVEGEERPGE